MFNSNSNSNYDPDITLTVQHPGPNGTNGPKYTYVFYKYRSAFSVIINIKQIEPNAVITMRSNNYTFGN